MKSNVLFHEGEAVPFNHCQTCGAKRMIGPHAEYFCGAKEHISADGSVQLVAPCPRNRPQGKA